MRATRAGEVGSRRPCLKRVFIACALTFAASTAAAQEQQVVVLQGLDKVTARISTLEVPIDQRVRFGTLEIRARACHKRPPDEPPETTAFLEIDEARPGEAPSRVFTGWMFASSPALSALEHPVYDVWVTDCRKADSSSSDRSR